MDSINPYLLNGLVHRYHMDESISNFRGDRCTAVSDLSLHCLPISQKWETGHSSSIGSESAWHASGPEFDPHIWHILAWRLGHENISMAILPLPLIQEEQLSVTGEGICTKYW